ncbi:biliverdin-producing heme oxygenase [Spirilliplanes yamanashiensis]|uniref:Biliverdin-producing heme oxygenase n=1 Tax=Spirilliplanes yamanashiensis TaxID=42233 RepID=A0A8J4DGJ3_9ACTN|nr:biliverdin-producing heme oxygenase [Spirilliplanes yamanashiensis]MDP9819985.1 heme oxygenase [Spirilliplanes yamanashiensis]GIJ01196.1 biliverdin-producing heme oxygenase [Spirilliplanes yamanashiensis]
MFSAELRAATAAAHRTAERGAYLDALLGGRLDRAGYAALVAQHWYVYRALEAAADDMRADPVAALFADERLTRLPALEADLAYLLGPDWRDAVRPGPATAAYAERLTAVCHDWPGGFVAHHYTRYLGDLSGGQYIAAAVAEIYGLPGRHGVAFYDFAGIDPGTFRDGYRDLLDAAPWDAAERARIVDEVLLAYRFNTDVFADLAADLDRWAVA